MCQSANRFSSTSLMCPSAWPGCLCAASAPRCEPLLECRRPLRASSFKPTVPSISWICIEAEEDIRAHTHTQAKRTALWYSPGRRADPVSSRSGFRCSVKNRIFYFLRALNSIQPLLLRRRLGVMQPDNTKVSWIIDYLADRPQFVPSRSTLLDLQQQRGIVLSTLFTASDCRLGSGSHRLHSLPDRLQRCSCSALYCAASDYFSDYTLLLAGMDSKHCKEARSILHSSAAV